MNVRNINRIIRLNPNSYLVKLEIFDDWHEIWDTVYYCVVYGDKADINKYLENEIKSGIFDNMIIDKISEEPPDNTWLYDPDTNTYVQT
jgi:hypothetical protein